jgi:hypothetical protein
VRAEFGRFGLRRTSRGPGGPAGTSLVRPRTLVALLVLGLLFVAASWVDAGTAASPDPDPSAKEAKAPAPDPYQPAAPATQEPVTPTVVQVQTTPSTGGVTRTPTQPRTDSTAGARTQKAPVKETERTAVPKERRKPVRLTVPAPSDGGPLLLGGIAMVVLALSSGSLLFLVTRAGNAGVGRWETKA